MPLKYLSNFWRTLDIALANCGISLDLKWSKNCVLTSKAARNALAAEEDNPAVAQFNNPTNAVFDITDYKLYVPVVALSAENENKLLEKLKTEFKRTIKWNKYRSEINNLNYLIDPTFTKVNRLFVLAFENEEHRSSFSDYYVPKVEAIIEISKNNDYTTGNLLDYE